MWLFFKFLIKYVIIELGDNMENKKENFKRIAENRVNKILSLLKQLENLNNTSYYEYTDEQIYKIFDILEIEMKNTRLKLIKENKQKGNKRFEL